MSRIFVPVLTFNFWVLDFVAKLRHVIESKIPVGYQDETGFHYGVKR